MKSQVLTGVILAACFAWAPVRAADLDRKDDNFVTANRVATASMKTVLEAKTELDDAIRIRVCQQEVIDSLKADFTDKLNNTAPKLERALSLLERLRQGLASRGPAETGARTVLGLAERGVRSSAEWH